VSPSIFYIIDFFFLIAKVSRFASLVRPHDATF
jgi:hypothetical protein